MEKAVSLRRLFIIHIRFIGYFTLAKQIYHREAISLAAQRQISPVDIPADIYRNTLLEV